MLRLLPALCLIMLTSACSSLPRLEQAPAWRAWCQSRGGIIDAAQSPSLTGRAESALARLGHPGSPSGTRIYVLAHDSVGAWAWPDGAIFVTRGLLEAMDDAELIAAIAHEMGHVADLDFASGQRASEHVADRIGLELLRRRGLDPGAMLNMLTALEARTPARYAEQIEQRRSLVEQRLELAQN